MIKQENKIRNLEEKSTNENSDQEIILKRQLPEQTSHGNDAVKSSRLLNQKVQKRRPQAAREL